MLKHSCDFPLLLCLYMAHVLLEFAACILLCCSRLSTSTVMMWRCQDFPSFSASLLRKSVSMLKSWWSSRTLVADALFSRTSRFVSFSGFVGLEVWLNKVKRTNKQTIILPNKTKRIPPASQKAKRKIKGPVFHFPLSFRWCIFI